MYEKNVEEEPEDEASNQLFEECDPRPVNPTPETEPVERVKYGGTSEQQKEAKRLMAN